jgi:spermidine dehydrogenase
MGDSDNDLGMGRKITRRDFMDGVALSVGAVAAGSVLGAAGASPAGASAARRGVYPPGLDGLRGQGSVNNFGHQLRNGTFWDGAGEPQQTGESYDLVVVGSGISGLAAARIFQQQVGRKARILVLEALDDVGGHARRNDFSTTHRQLIGYGGSQSLEAPSSFAPVAKRLIDDIGIEPQRFEKYFDTSFRSRHHLGDSVFLDKESWGTDFFARWHGTPNYRKVLAGSTLSAATRAKIEEIYHGKVDYLAGLTRAEKKDRLDQITYLDFLRDHAGADADTLKFLQTVSNGNWGYGIDAVGGLDAWVEPFPGFGGVFRPYWDDHPDPRMAPTAHKLWYAEDDYIYHFPEGNAGVVYSLVRRLIPDALPGTGMKTIPTTRIRYGRLDRAGSRVRIRLNAPAVRVKHVGDPADATEVEVTYLSGDTLQVVRAANVVMACQNSLIPYLTDELGDPQREALLDSRRLALCYTNVEVRNWKALKKAEVSHIRYPTAYWQSIGLDYPVSMGTYHFPDRPRQRALLHVMSAFCKPGSGEHPQDQAAYGRRQLASTSFEEMELALRDQLARALGPFGFDPAEDILSITVNRWAHAYAYEYARPWDQFWPRGPLPNHVARRRWGRVAIANTDSAPRAYVDAAIGMAARAVAELTGSKVPGVANGVDGIDPAGLGPG